jgi:hypothetical protein
MVGCWSRVAGMITLSSSFTEPTMPLKENHQNTDVWVCIVL